MENLFFVGVGSVRGGRELFGGCFSTDKMLDMKGDWP